jgi:hypothetical protein
LPRTGGTTIRNLLLPLLLKRVAPEQVFLVDMGPEYGCRCGTVEDLAALPRGERRQIRFVSGHMPLHVITPLEDPVLFTMLRSPVERALSEYWYCFHERTSPAHAVARALTPLEYCERGYGYGPNGQARFLSGAAWDEIAPSDHDLYDRAMKALRSINYIGKFEQFQRTLDNIADLAGVDRLTASTRLNIAERLAEVPPRTDRGSPS